MSYIFIKYYFTPDTTLFKCYGWYCDRSNKLGGSVMTSFHSSTYWFLVIIEPRSAIFFVSVRQCFQIIFFLPYSLFKKKCPNYSCIYGEQGESPCLLLHLLFFSHEFVLLPFKSDQHVLCSVLCGVWSLRLCDLFLLWYHCLLHFQ